MSDSKNLRRDARAPELLGYAIIALFSLAWASAVLLWKLRYGQQEPTHSTRQV